MVQPSLRTLRPRRWLYGTPVTPPIRGEHLLEPVTLVVEGAAILEATVRKVSRPVIKLDLHPNEALKGRVQLSWAILEHADGAVIQIIYAGRPELVMHVDGTVEGQSQLSLESRELAEQESYIRHFFWGAFMLVIALRFRNEEPASTFAKFMCVFCILFALVGLGFGLEAIWNNYFHAGPSFVIGN